MKIGGAGAVHVSSMTWKAVLGSGGAPIVKAADLAPNMGSVFVHQRLRGISKKQFGNDSKADVLLAIKCLLKNVAAVTVHSELYNTTPYEEFNK